MAIPHWTWPGDDPGSTADPLVASTAALDVVADPTRAEILATLHDAAAPLPHADLFAHTSVADKGRLNYHLRELGGDYLARDDDCALTDRGERVVAALLAAEPLREPSPRGTA